MPPKTRRQKQEAAAQTPNSDPNQNPNQASPQNTGSQRSTSNSPSKFSCRRQKKRDKSKSPQHPPKVPVQESSTISPESQAPTKKQHKNEDLQTMDTTSPPAKVTFNDQDQHIETPPAIQRQTQLPESNQDLSKFPAKKDMKLTKDNPKSYFYRVIARTGIAPLKLFNAECFRNPEVDYDLNFLTSFFREHSQYKTKFRNEELWITNEAAKFIVKSAVYAGKDPHNIFYPMNSDVA
jgi:hypothetical protein